MRRRRFIENSTKAALLGAFVNQPILRHSNYGSADEQINVGIIGTGGRGAWLTRLMQDIPELTAMACCDIIPSRLENGLKQASENAKSYEDYRHLLENNEVNAVVIATPLSLHFEMAKAALQAGKHVYCEKTMCFTTEEAIELEKIVEGRDLIFQVGYQHRYNPLYNQIKSVIQGDEFGELSHIECYWNRNGDWRRPVEDPKLERIINWRMYREFSGGLMAELSSHQIDIVNWILDETPSTVMGYGGIDYWKDGRETFDNTHSIFKYKSGVKASFTCLTTNAYQGFQMLFYGKNATIQVKGEQGHKAYIYIEPAYTQKLQKPDNVDAVSGATLKVWESGEGIPLGTGGPEDDAEPTGKALAGFAACIKENKKPLSNVINGKNTAACVALGNQAMQKEEIIKLNAFM